MSKAEELAIEMLLLTNLSNTGRGPAKCDPRRLAAAELRRLAQVERELEALKASIGEPVAWYDEDMDSAYTVGEMDGYKVHGLVPLYAIKEVK